jgi:hypothetical protein
MNMTNISFLVARIRSEYRRQLPENAVFQFGLDFIKCTYTIFFRLAQLWYPVVSVPYVLFIHVYACYYVSVLEYI